jgi:diguanylate cyclase
MPFDRRWRYAALGALLALGAPAGLGLLAALGLHSEAVVFAYVSVSTLAAFSAFGYALGRQAERLDQAGLTDPLTGLGNRRRFQERLALECARAARYGESLALLLADLDGLKDVNDREGHRAGDALLREVASVILADLRQVDLGARWGGDEFGVLAPRTEAREALALAERIRAEVQRQTAATVSIGVAATGGQAFDPEALLRAADIGLYAAKQAGRNRICLAPGVDVVGS